jgi:ABC-type multidrug transport system fused ATPase/permease subunit
LSFKINKGEYVSFVGQSGSGKSTIIKLIERFYHIEKGKILMGNTDSALMNLGEMRKQIGMVNQEATIFSGTIEDNISYGLDDYTQDDLM